MTQSRFHSEKHRLLVSIVQVSEQLIKTADRFFHPYGLTLTQFNLLVVLLSHPEGIPQSQLSEEMVVSRANISGLAKRVRDLGLIKISADPADGRVRRVAITAKGKKRVAELHEAHLDEIDSIARKCKNSDATKACTVLDIIAQRLHDLE